MTRIFANLWVERDSQRIIMIGSKGSRLKEIGTTARGQIEPLVGTKVFLSLHVKVAKSGSATRSSSAASVSDDTSGGRRSPLRWVEVCAASVETTPRHELFERCRTPVRGFSVDSLAGLNSVSDPTFFRLRASLVVFYDRRRVRYSGRCGGGSRRPRSGSGAGWLGPIPLEPARAGAARAAAALVPRRRRARRRGGRLAAESREAWQAAAEWTQGAAR